MAGYKKIKGARVGKWMTINFPENSQLLSLSLHWNIMCSICCVTLEEEEQLSLYYKDGLHLRPLTSWSYVRGANESVVNNNDWKRYERIGKCIKGDGRTGRKEIQEVKLHPLDKTNLCIDYKHSRPSGYFPCGNNKMGENKKTAAEASSSSLDFDIFQPKITFFTLPATNTNYTRSSSHTVRHLLYLWSTYLFCSLSIGLKSF